MNHSIPAIVPLDGLLIGIIEAHVQVAEEVGEAEV